MVVQEHDRGTCFAFSPDGKTLASGTYGGDIYLWEITTGKERWHFRGHQDDIWALAFSPDGKLLASGGRDKLMHVWDLASQQERNLLAGHAGLISALAFSPDGRSLASASFDTTALIWDIAGLPTPKSLPSHPLSVAELESLWADLAAADAFWAYRGIWALVQGRPESLACLKKKLQPVQGPDVQQTNQLLAKLDDEHFGVREGAEKELEKLGALVEPELRRALAGNPSVEFRRRTERLLAKLEEPVTRPEQLRSIRVVEVLEHMGSSEARGLLKALAQGAPPARLTREAQQALERLNRLAPRK